MPERVEEVPTIGIIYPPPEVRNIVDKTASFVARNGPEFESRIRQNELGNPKFNFLTQGDPYHAYYVHKVKDLREKAAQEPTLPPKETKSILSTATQLKQQELLKQAQEAIFVPKDPPKEFEFIADPPSISALDLDTVKLTALFVARNGRQFLTNLMAREQRNFQFDFLRPQHSLFQYFTKLLEQYTKVLMPPKDLIKCLKEESYDRQKILDDVKYRAEWQKHQDALRRKEEQLIEKERLAYSQIDWHDFVVVETVDFQYGEIGNFPQPTTPDQVGVRTLMQERVDNGEEAVEMSDAEDDMQVDSDDEMEKRVNGRTYAPESELKVPGEEKSSRDNNQVQDMDESSSDDDGDLPPGVSKSDSRSNQMTQPAVPEKVIVKKGYNPKQIVRAPVKAPPEEYLISPITGEKIPASKVQEHMRIGLLDPRWVEQRDKHISDKMNQESVYAPGAAIEASLKQLAERRTDIFGVGVEETAIGKKIGEEESRKDDKATWDGHTSSVEAATRAARANITLEDQIHQIHKVKGLIHDDEKEKIGPKPVSGTVTISHPPTSQAVSVQMSMANNMQNAMMQPHAPNMMQSQSMIMVQQQQQMMVPQPQAYQVMQPQMPPNPFLGATRGMMQPPLPQGQPGMKHIMEIAEDEPLMKKQKTEDSLEPEIQFMMKFNGPVMFNVGTPVLTDKPEWALNGQILNITLPLQETVSVIKTKIHELTGMPPGKQKLQCDGLFFKDSNTLAYYNIGPGTTIHLQLKERGGRKK
ncbi:splicing factor 3A subunit 1 [Acyrthosiphon pisum]|uniref:Splicing factor 3A subunit 1 n=1 Tax=Acyrthosiphon pisum TaxID=7029 RepID=A0A8R2NM35_ACYPI|nr:splicing factor 3A subunit 1 [Acyrthosiphon pisum]XP_029343158.1 splicing factor 3A subunit 1 [Acyrthosiphon pisum]|eukprot:XP_001944050.2 PREDICTED: splicing factor 3A subunit 1 [Acyrthosiphon pisum]